MTTGLVLPALTAAERRADQRSRLRLFVQMCREAGIGRMTRRYLIEGMTAEDIHDWTCHG